jgi:hypothetical protein
VPPNAGLCRQNNSSRAAVTNETNSGTSSERLLAIGLG